MKMTTVVRPSLRAKVIVTTAALALAAASLVALRAGATPNYPAGLPIEAYDNCQEDVQPQLWMDLGCMDDAIHRRIFECYDDGGIKHLWGQIVPCGQPMCNAGYTYRPNANDSASNDSGCPLCHTLDEWGSRTFMPAILNFQPIIGTPWPPMPTPAPTMVP